MVKSISFSLSVIDRNWDVESIKFPYEEISIYNLDKVSDLLKKLQLILDVHPQQIHLRGLTVPFDEWLKKNKANLTKDENEEQNVHNLASIKEDSEATHTFNLYFNPETNDNIYPKLIYKRNIINTSIPIHALYQPGITMISGVPCDNQYILFKKIAIDNTDVFLTDFTPINHVVIFLLDDYITKNSATALHVLHDKFIFERVYDGFIKKYFPSMSTIDFQKYLSDNLPKDEEKLENHLTYEHKVFSDLMKFSVKKGDELKMKKFISAATLLVPRSDTQAAINLRNLLDKLHISPLYNDKDLQIFMMYFEMPSDKPNKKYIINKFRSNSQNFKITSKYKEGLTIIRSIKKFLEYINITEHGDWTITTSWKDEQEMDIQQIIEYNITSTLPVIKHINTLTPFFAKEPLTLMNKSITKISHITVCIIWNRILNFLEFRLLRQTFNEFVMAGMAENRTSPILEVVWNKGVINTCVIKIYHRVTDIKIEIIDTNPKDYKNILDILIPFLLRVNDLINHMPKSKETSEQKLIRKLREQDSQLYDKLKEGNIYSKKCQGIRQPIILTDEEFDKLKSSEKTNVYKFWNFTKDKHAYYTCQIDPATKKPLVMSFLTGIHEDDFCVPCCKKKILNEDSKHHERDHTCMDKHVYNKVSESSTSGYIFVSGKSINIGRLGYLPNTIIDILETQDITDVSVDDVNQLRGTANSINKIMTNNNKGTIEDLIEENINNNVETNYNDNDNDNDDMSENEDVDEADFVDYGNVRNAFEVDEELEGVNFDEDYDDEFIEIVDDKNIEKNKDNKQDELILENYDDYEDGNEVDFTIGRKYGGMNTDPRCIDVEDVSLFSIAGGKKRRGGSRYILGGISRGISGGTNISNSYNTHNISNTIKQYSEYIPQPIKNNVYNKVNKYVNNNIPKPILNTIKHINDDSIIPFDISNNTIINKVYGGYKIKNKNKEKLNLVGKVSNTYLNDNPKHFYAYGVQQNFNAVDNAGIVYAITHAMDMTIADFIGKIVEYIKDNENSTFSPILSDALVNIFVNNIDFYDWEADWASLFADLVLEVFDINLVIFRPLKDSVRIRYNMSPKILILQYDFDKKIEFYPIYKIDTVLYNKRNIIDTKIFPIITEIDKLIPTSLTNDLTYIQNIKEIVIKKQLINLNNKCYAIIASYKDNNSEEAYIPVLYSPLVSRIPLEYKVFKRSDYKLSLDTALNIIKLLHGKTTSTLWYYDIKKTNTEYKVDVLGNHNEIPEDIKTYVTFIGFVHDGLNVYCNDLTYDQLSKSHPDLVSVHKYITDIDYDDINNVIVNSKTMLQFISDLYSDGHYYQHLYKLIKLELINLIDSGVIHIDTVKQMSVEKLMNLIPHEIDDNAKTDSNILISCSKTPLTHCDEAKLKVPSNFKDYCEILHHEIHNPVINFMNNPRSLVVSMLNFEEVPGEKTIIKIADVE
jgi:hypothetical protein